MITYEYTEEFGKWLLNLDSNGQGIVDGYLQTLNERHYLREPYARTEHLSRFSPKLWTLFPAYGDRSYRVYYVVRGNSGILLLGFDAMQSLSIDLEVKEVDSLIEDYGL